MASSRPGQKVWSRRVAQGCLLALALLFVAMVSYLPHMDLLEGQVNPTGGVSGRSEENPWSRLVGGYGAWFAGEHEDYRYPVHVDAHVHWVRSAAIQSDETVRFDHPYTGESRTETPLSLRGLVHETGFWVAFAQFQEMTGIEWLQLVRFAPMMFAMVTASLVWAAMRPSPAAPLAAAFVALVPTSARFLGIGFFVPIGISLAWVAAALLLSRHAFAHPRFFLFALLLGSWAFFVHLIGGFAFLLVVGAAALVSWRGNRSRTVLLGAGVALPFLAFFDAFRDSFQVEIEKLGRHPLDFTVFDQLGLPVLVLWVLGTGLVLLVPPRGRLQVPLFAATAVSIVALGFITLNVALDLRAYALYDRWHPIFALTAAVPVSWALYSMWRGVRLLVEAAWAAVWARRRLLRSGRSGGASQEEVPATTGAVSSGVPAASPVALVMGPGARAKEVSRLPRGAPSVLAVAGLLVMVSAFGFVTAPGLAAHLDEPYYHVMDDEMWVAFQVAKDLPEEYEVFLTEPWRAPVFTAVSGKHPHTWLNPGSPPVRGEDYAAYLNGGYEDGVWLVSRDISVVIDRQAPTDPAFETIAPNVHVLDPESAKALYDARRGG